MEAVILTKPDDQQQETHRSPRLQTAGAPAGTPLFLKPKRVGPPGPDEASHEDRPASGHAVLRPIKPTESPLHVRRGG